MDLKYDFDKYEFLSDEVFMVPCGMHIRDQLWVWDISKTGALCYGGNEYSYENGNPAIHVNDLMDKCFNCNLTIYAKHGHKHLFNACEGRITKEPFNFENSLNKIKMDYDIAFYRERDIKYPDHRCPCIHQERDRVKVRYDIHSCMNYGHNGCENKICIITKNERDTTYVNIFGDVKYTADKGLLTEHEVINKGIKILNHKITMECAERKIKELEAMSEEQWRWEYKHASDVKPFKFYVKVKNGRDLLEDLTDIKAGIEVIHDSDMRKKAAAIKREKREKAKEKRILKKIKRNDVDTNISQYEQIGMF